MTDKTPKHGEDKLPNPHLVKTRRIIQREVGRLNLAFLGDPENKPTGRHRKPDEPTGKKQ